MERSVKLVWGFELNNSLCISVNFLILMGVLSLWKGLSLSVGITQYSRTVGCHVDNIQMVQEKCPVNLANFSPSLRLFQNKNYVWYKKCNWYFFLESTAQEIMVYPISLSSSNEHGPMRIAWLKTEFSKSGVGTPLL